MWLCMAFLRDGLVSCMLMVMDLMWQVSFCYEGTDLWESVLNYFMSSIGNSVHVVMHGISARWIGFLYANGDGLNVAGVILL